MTELPTDELRALLAEPLDRFVAVRNERVKSLRSAGRREEAALLATVRKPSQLTSRLAQLARSDGDAAVGAVQAAEDLEAAQEGDGDLREALAALRPAIDAVLATASSRDRVDLGVPLRTVLADPDARGAWLNGLLVELPGPETVAPAPTGRHLTLVPAGPDATPPAGGTRRRGSDDGSARRAEEQRAVEARAEARRALQAQVDEAQAALVAAQHDLDGAHARLGEAEERRADARRGLDDAEAEVATYGDDVAHAGERLASLQLALEVARAALEGAGPARRRRR